MDIVDQLLQGDIAVCEFGAYSLLPPRKLPLSDADIWDIAREALAGQSVTGLAKRYHIDRMDLLARFRLAGVSAAIKEGALQRTAKPAAPVSKTESVYAALSPLECLVLPELRASLLGLGESLTKGDTAAAEDFVNETLCKAFCDIGGERIIENGYRGMRSFCFKILRNIVATDRQRKKFVVPVENYNQLVETYGVEGEQERGQLLLDPFSKAFDALSQDKRDVLVAVGGWGLSYNEAAQYYVGAPLGTVQSRISRTRQELNDVMSRHGLDRDGNPAHPRLDGKEAGGFSLYSRLDWA